jgi:nitronate monooxygenase
LPRRFAAPKLLGMSASSDFLDRLGIAHPIVQAPMAGVSTPALAAAVSNAGGLGSIGVAATGAQGARAMIEELRGRTNRGFNVNVFCHRTDAPDAAHEAAWLEAMAPLFRRYGAQPPPSLRPIYKSFLDDEAMFSVLLAAAPKVVSFHFGLPAAEKIVALRQAGSILVATATTLAEAEAAKAAGMDALVAQGFEAGGHRGVFDPAADRAIGTFALTRLLALRSGLPVIAAGGIMDGAGIAAALTLGAAAAQLGTAFVACPESAADAAYRAALAGPAASETTVTSAISGRPARGLRNHFTDWGRQEAAGLATPGYPMTYDAGKALNAAAKAKGETGFGAQWAGQGAPLARPLPAAELMRVLVKEMEAARSG